MSVRIELYDLSLGKKLKGAGWKFFYRANEVQTTSFDEQSRIHHATAQHIKGFQQETFNILEVTRIANRSSWRVPCLTRGVHGRHIQLSSSLYRTLRASP